MSAKPTPEPKEADKFRDAMKKILAVPKAEILRREAEEKAAREEAKGKDSSELHVPDV